MKQFLTPIALSLTTAAALASASAQAGDTPAPDGAAVYIVNLSDGDRVSSPVTVVFGMRGMGVAPAGVEAPNTGHHHLLINTPMLSGDALNDPIPADENHRHFGGGQTEVTLPLGPGAYTLQLLAGDHNHIPHAPPVMSEPITIQVQ